MKGTVKECFSEEKFDRLRESVKQGKSSLMRVALTMNHNMVLHNVTDELIPLPSNRSFHDPVWH